MVRGGTDEVGGGGGGGEGEGRKKRISKTREAGLVMSHVSCFVHA